MANARLIRNEFKVTYAFTSKEVVIDDTAEVHGQKDEQLAFDFDDDHSLINASQCDISNSVYLTIPEACDLLHVSRSTICSYFTKGLLQKHKITRKVYISRAEILDLIESSKVK